MARLLITAGPTYEPIDAVRFIGNRSSGQLGSDLAQYACQTGWDVRLLLGPNATKPEDNRIQILRFGSSHELEDMLSQHLTWCDCLIMSAAVADYRPIASEVDLASKRSRTDQELSIKFEPTPDLLAGCSKKARPNQLLVGFALEQTKLLEQSAKHKLTTKNIDLIVANPLQTMDADTIDAHLIGNPDRGIEINHRTDGPISKQAFATWLLNHLTPLVAQRLATPKTNTEQPPHVSL